MAERERTSNNGRERENRGEAVNSWPVGPSNGNKL
jgi:hypothetical protein